jgi:hypothetical protein
MVIYLSVRVPVLFFRGEELWVVILPFCCASGAINLKLGLTILSRLTKYTLVDFSSPYGGIFCNQCWQIIGAVITAIASGSGFVKLRDISRLGRRGICRTHKI